MRPFLVNLTTLRAVVVNPVREDRFTPPSAVSMGTDSDTHSST